YAGELAVVLDPQVARGKPFVVNEIGPFERCRHAFEELRLRRQVNGDELAVAAAEREGLRGGDPRQPVAFDSRARVVRERIGNEGDARLQHIDVDAMAAAA